MNIFQDLPIDVHRTITDYLYPRDISTLATTCQYMYDTLEPPQILFMQLVCECGRDYRMMFGDNCPTCIKNPMLKYQPFNGQKWEKCRLRNNMDYHISQGINQNTAMVMILQEDLMIDFPFLIVQNITDTSRSTSMSSIANAIRTTVQQHYANQLIVLDRKIPGSRYLILALNRDKHQLYMDWLTYLQDFLSGVLYSVCKHKYYVTLGLIPQHLHMN